MIFDFKKYLDKNTIGEYNETIKKTFYCAFIAGKRFVSNDGVSEFEHPGDLKKAVYDSYWWTEVKKYIDYSAKFFKKDDDEEWKKDFSQSVWENMVKDDYIEIKRCVLYDE